MMQKHRNDGIVQLAIDPSFRRYPLDPTLGVGGRKTQVRPRS
jgi:hypothetical protein